MFNFQPFHVKNLNWQERCVTYAMTLPFPRNRSTLIQVPTSTRAELYLKEVREEIATIDRMS